VGQEVEDLNYVANNPYSNTYNPGWKNHPNFSYRNQSNVQNPIKNPRLTKGVHMVKRTETISVTNLLDSKLGTIKVKTKVVTNPVPSNSPKRIWT
jgi:hypothetical protein